MKKLLIIFSVLILGQMALAALTPMHIIEKSSYQIKNLVKKNKINASFLSDITDVTVTATNGEYQLHMTSPSSQQSINNYLDMVMGSDAKLKSFTTQFNSPSAQSPILTAITTAQVLDLGAEAFVDHLHESQENVLIAENVKQIQLVKVEGGVTLKIHLVDTRIYTITLNNNGDVVARGF